MKWSIWITWWIIFYIKYPRLVWIYIKKAWGKTVNPSVKIYTNKIQNRITFKTKTGNQLKLSTPETKELLESTRSKITKKKNGEKVPYLKITEVVLIHYNVVNNKYQQNSRVLYTFVLNKSFGQLLAVSHENFIF